MSTGHGMDAGPGMSAGSGMGAGSGLSVGPEVSARRWLPAVVVGIAIVAATMVELSQSFVFVRSPLVGPAFALCLGAAVGAARWAPELALGMAWGAGLLQVVGGVPVLLTEASLVFVLFAAARWGRSGAVVVAGISAVLAPVIALVWASIAGINLGFAGEVLRTVIGAATESARGTRLLLLGLVVFAIPYLAGLTLRSLDRAQVAQKARTTAEREARQAQEIARLQEAQNRLARDVHDVVGHSLTVILAQAESAQYVDDPEQLKRTMEIIAASARSSLRDVRQVLTPGAARGTGGLDTLIESVRASGHPVQSTEFGVARPLPPELDTVAYRVLQELLTNAIKHGRRDQPVVVEQHWPARDDTGGVLTIVVRNVVDDTGIDGTDVDGVGGAPSGGQGLVGIRRRLEAVGGRFEVERRQEEAGEVFCATARVPVRQLLPGESRVGG
jgi:Signal transduction histidine kinase